MTAVLEPSADAQNVQNVRTDPDRYSRLAGDADPAPVGEPYQVAFTSLGRKHGHRLRPFAYALGNIAFEAVFLAWLLAPSHRPALHGSRLTVVAGVFVLAAIALMETLRLINVVSLSVASVVARDPVPVVPQPDLKVAFVTTMVPELEPLSTVRATLAAARQIRHPGGIDVWLLDEGDDPKVKAVCASLGVRHFSRKGRDQYNQASGPFRARTKHGNYNSWLDAHGQDYAVFMSVDPDHVPVPNFAERILGYFRDPDVAFVVGPQVYGNCEGSFVTKAAESQQFPFHSVIQRAANYHGVPMLVGTNNAMRVSALTAVGGLQDSVTEDMATGLAVHASRNPDTGRQWKSVYTPDVLAIGEGPARWRDYFTQQGRWSRGTFETLAGPFWRRAVRLRPGQLLHYGLITTFYPSMALGWILGATNAVLFGLLGVRGVVVPPRIWLMLFTDATLFQVWLYVWNRRYNVSPYEAAGSFGFVGMLMSVLASPVFAHALVNTFLRKRTSFVVTPKGDAAQGDSLLTFRWHFFWALVFGTALVLARVNGYASVAGAIWPTLSLVTCLVPAVIWGREHGRRRRAPALTALRRPEMSLPEEAP